MKRKVFDDGEIEPDDLTTTLLDDDIKEAVRREEARKAKVITEFSSQLVECLGQSLFDKFLFAFGVNPNGSVYATFVYKGLIYRISRDGGSFVWYVKSIKIHNVYQGHDHFSREPLHQHHFTNADDLLLWLDTLPDMTVSSNVSPILVRVIEGRQVIFWVTFFLFAVIIIIVVTRI